MKKMTPVKVQRICSNDELVTKIGHIDELLNQHLNCWITVGWNLDAKEQLSWQLKTIFACLFVTTDDTEPSTIGLITCCNTLCKVGQRTGCPAPQWWECKFWDRTQCQFAKMKCKMLVNENYDNFELLLPKARSSVRTAKMSHSWVQCVNEVSGTGEKSWFVTQLDKHEMRISTGTAWLFPVACSLDLD